MSARHRWLSALRPRPGRRLPRELRAEYVGAIASRLPEGLRGADFEALLHRIDEGPIHGGNRVEIFVHGDDALASKKDAIEAAESQILLESYILRDDETGRDVLEALAAAVGRGVEVKVLADAFGSLTTGASYWREMKKRGIEVRLFHPFWPYPWFQIFRDHRKILVADQRIGFVGGMNLGREYGSFRRGRGGTWRDTDARVEGPVVRELALVFSEAWSRAGGSAVELAPAHRAPGSPKARILVLESRPGRGHQESASVLAAIAAAARGYLWVTNAYFAPRALALRALGRAVERGVDVRLLLPGKSDLPLVRHAGHGYFRELLEAGVRLFEYQDAILHAKTLVADDFVSLVGSSNLDFRSFHLNAEVNLVVMDESVASDMAAAFQEDLNHSVEMKGEEWDRRPWLHKIGDAVARRLYVLL